MGGDVGADKRALLEGLTDEQRKWIALLAADSVGHLASAPFAMRNNANHVRMSAGLNQLDGEIAAENARIVELQREWDEYRQDMDEMSEIGASPLTGAGPAVPPPRPSLDDGSPSSARLRELEAMRDAVGERVGSNPSVQSTVLWFDALGPGGEGEIVEMFGSLEGAENVGVIVPGTTHGMHKLGGVGGNTERTQSFQGETTPMITWMGADLPDEVASDAPFNHYAKDAAPQLAAFTDQLHAEVQALGVEADIAVAGHSYGGSVLGTAAANGLRADRIFHIESAGGGVGVDSPDDYTNLDADDVYVMTDDDDAINYSQGIGVGGIGHGVDPDMMDAHHVYTGDLEDGTEIEGATASHSDVFLEDSDAWVSMEGFFSRGDVTLRPLDKDWRSHLIDSNHQIWWDEVGPGDVLAVK